MPLSLGNKFYLATSRLAVVASITIFAVLFSLSAHATLVNLETPYEVDGFQVSLNADNTGWLTFRKCERCRPQRALLTKDSKILLDGKPKEVKFLLTATGYQCVILTRRGSDKITRILFSSFDLPSE